MINKFNKATILDLAFLAIVLTAFFSVLAIPTQVSASHICQDECTIYFQECLGTVTEHCVDDGFEKKCTHECNGTHGPVCGGTIEVCEPDPGNPPPPPPPTYPYQYPYPYPYPTPGIPYTTPDGYSYPTPSSYPRNPPPGLSCNLNSGVISYAGYWYASDEYPARAFDGFTNTRYKGDYRKEFCEDDPDNPDNQICEWQYAPEVYIGLTYSGPVSVRRIVATRPGSDSDFTGSIQYSDNGSAWTSADDFGFIMSATNSNAPNIADLHSEFGAHRYWRILDTNSGFHPISELEFYDCAVPAYNLTVSKSGTGTGTVTSNTGPINCGATCSGGYNEGTSVTLTATSSPGSTFTGWSGGGCSGAGSCVTTVNASTTVTATFAPATYSLTVSVAAGSGTITGQGINCPGDCTETYTSGTLLSLIATPAAGSDFSSWSSGAGTICGGQGSSCLGLIDGPKTASANFTASFNYSLTPTNQTITVTKSSSNQNAQNTISKTRIAGTAEAVTLAISGPSGPLPSGVSASISNQGCNPTCSSNINFTVSPTAQIGTHTITVTGSTVDGTPTNKTTTFSLVINGNPMVVSCSANPSPALLNQNVLWTGRIVSGGTPPFTYSWSGTNIPTSPAPSGLTYNKVYNTIGQKTTTFTVTDADGLQASFTTNVQINFDPELEEF